MFKKFVLFTVIVSVLAGCTANIKKETDIAENEIKGSDKIQDIELRKTIISFFDSKTTTKDEFKYLSKKYLSKYCPNVKSAQEYEKYLENIGEESAKSEYLEISDCKKLGENEYQATIIILAPDAPGSKDMLKIKKGFSFIKEDNIWKYNGSIRGTYEVLEEK